MRYGKIFLIVVLVAGKQSVASAQSGGLLNKAKEKVKEKIEQQPFRNTLAAAKAGTVDTTNSVKNSLVLDTKWEIGSSNGYTSGGFRYDIEMLEKDKPISPYVHMRKVDETGVFHFAKDYPELKNIIEPENKSINISFSSAPYKGGKGIEASQFNSGTGHIYARLQVAGGITIKEALKLSGDLSKLTVNFYVYPQQGDVIGVRDNQAAIILNASQINNPAIDFDIKPAPDNITSYINPADRYDFYLSQFPFMHDNSFFAKNGNYKIAVKITTAIKDGWGNPTGKVLEVMNSFDYVFEAKDAKTVYDEGQQVMKALQTGIRYTPEPMPREWKQASAAPAVAGYTAAKYNQLYNKHYKDVKIIKIYLAPVAGSPWKVIMSNDNIMPSYKYCTQTVFFFVKDAAGNCYYHPCDLRQDYAGGGTYSDIFLAVFDEEKVYVNCSELK
jgi:hypothetical protein